MCPTVFLRPELNSIARSPLELVLSHGQPRVRIHFAAAGFPDFFSNACGHIDHSNRPRSKTFFVCGRSVDHIEQANVSYSLSVRRPARLDVPVNAWFQESDFCRSR